LGETEGETESVPKRSNELAREGRDKVEEEDDGGQDDDDEDEEEEEERGEERATSSGDDRELFPPLV